MMMMNKWLAAFALLGVSAVSAKTYDITLSEPSTVGKVQLQPGQYRLKLNASSAVFTEVKTGKSFPTSPKVEQDPAKSEYTSVETKNVAGQTRIEEIRLRGSKIKLEFN